MFFVEQSFLYKKETKSKSTTQTKKLFVECGVYKNVRKVIKSRGHKNISEIRYSHFFKKKTKKNKRRKVKFSLKKKQKNFPKLNFKSNEIFFFEKETKKHSTAQS